MMAATRVVRVRRLDLRWCLWGRGCAWSYKLSFVEARPQQPAKDLVLIAQASRSSRRLIVGVVSLQSTTDFVSAAACAVVRQSRVRSVRCCWRRQAGACFGS
jgi:hypothetical protein